MWISTSFPPDPERPPKPEFLPILQSVSMNYYIISGEASGDLHGSRLIRALRHQDPEARFRCWGGDLMQAEGAEVVKHYRDLAFMGFSEVIRHLPQILSLFRFCKRDLREHRPDVLILIDYPGFNLRMAQWAREQGLRIVYYISPQVWAWKEKRVKTIRRCVDLMLVILPFEKAFYRTWKMEVTYVGHPLVEIVDDFIRQSPEPADDRQTIALLPGSRKQEILKKLPVMLETSLRFPEFHFALAMAPGQDPAFYRKLVEGYPSVELVAGGTYALLRRSRAALVTSGTATLETALFGVPQVICYRGSALSYQIARRLVKVKYIGLVNLIMDREVVKELIQQACNTERLSGELRKLLEDEAHAERIREDYRQLRGVLGAGRSASAEAAAAILGLVRISGEKTDGLQSQP